MNLLECLFVLIAALYCCAAPASDSDVPAGTGQACGRPPLVNFGDTKENRKFIYPSGSFVTYICMHYYKLEGNEKIYCKDGEWEKEPVCQEPCTVKESEMKLNNIKLKYRDANKLYSMHFDIITFACLPNYEISDESLLRVQCLGGKLNYPKCFKKGFCKLEQRKMDENNIRYSGGDIVENENSITFKCAEGMIPEDNLEAKCLQKRINYPRCSDPNTTCRHPPTVLNGVSIGIIKDKYFKGERVTYQCASGYSFKNNINYVTCEDSQWTEKPVCRRTGQSCGRPPIVNFGDTRENRKDIYPSGSFVTYICMHYYMLEGKEKNYCKDGEWEKEPVCREPCTVTESEVELNNIRLKYRDAKKLYITHFDNITFACLPNYEISDATLLRIQCLDGKLNYPKCFKKGFCKLERPKMDENNIRYSGGDIVENESSITFECAEGMIPEDNLEAKCVNKRINYPRCSDALPCSAPEILHVLISPEKKNYNSGSSADINCQEPYVISGPRSITCNNGWWSELPKCLSPCTISVESLNEKNLDLESKEDLAKTYHHDEEVNVKCKENFKRPRHPTAICNNGEMKYDKCFSSRICRIVQDKLDSNALELDERHDNEVYYGENETVYFKCKDGSKTLTGTCAKDQKSQNLQLTYPDCLEAAP